MSEKERPVRRTTTSSTRANGDGVKQTTVRRTNASARTAGTARPGSSTRSGTSSQTVKKTAATGTRRPAAKRKAPARRQLFGFDMETVIALALIAVVLVAIIALAVVGIKRCSDRNTTKVVVDVANIHPEETAQPVLADATQLSADTGETVTDQPTQTAVSVPIACATALACVLFCKSGLRKGYSFPFMYFFHSSPSFRP